MIRDKVKEVTRSKAEKTVGDLFRLNFPDEEKRLKKNGFWDYAVVSPESLDDIAEITVYVQWNENEQMVGYVISLI